MNTCRICGSARVATMGATETLYLRCRDCGAVARSITAQEYAALEPTYDPGPNVASNERSDVRAYLGVEGKKDVLRPLVEALSSTGPRVLDVGCGAGGYLLAAEELGCRASGVEPSVSHSSVGRALGLDITTGYFQPGMYAAASFDLVILSHVIEHIYEPRPFLEELFKLVRPNGYLVVVTPNADSIVARLSGRDWVMLRPIDHVSMLTERSFRAMGIDSWGTATFRQSEYVWEPLASLASAALGAARRAFPKRRARTAPTLGQETSSSPSTPLAPSIGWRRSAEPIRKVFGVIGRPLHSVAVRTRRQACLTLELRKRSEFASR